MFCPNKAKENPIQSTIVPVWTICEELLITLGDHTSTSKMLDADVMITPIIGRNHNNACCMLKINGYILICLDIHDNIYHEILCKPGLETLQHKCI